MQESKETPRLIPSVCFQVAIETYNSPFKIAFGLPDNGVYMVPRIAADI